MRPDVKDVARRLRELKTMIPVEGETEDDEDADPGYMDVRLQVYPSGEWAVRFGDPSYDLDHRGYWGASCMSHDTDCQELARELIDEAEDQAAEMGEPFGTDDEDDEEFDDDEEVGEIAQEHELGGEA